MPRQKIRDPIKGEILDCLYRGEVTADAMADALDISRSTFYRMLKAHTDTWPVGKLRTALKCCGLELHISV